MNILLILFFPLITNSQIIYTGNIINKTTGQKIPFATVGLLKENIGTNADQEGNFSLTKGKYKNDTLIISCVGYEPSKFPVDNLPSNSQFEIQERKILLSNIILQSNYKSSSILNDYANCGFSSYTSSGSVTQIAQHLQLPVANSLLSEILICKEGDNSLFRIRVYDMDSITVKPSNDLADTIIEINSGKRHVQVKLEKYNIIIPGKDFFVGIEWLYIPSNKSKIKAKKDGQKISYTQYSPFIFFKNRKIGNDNPEKSLEAWQLDFRRKWIRTYQDWVFLISAKVKY